MNPLLIPAIILAALAVVLCVAAVRFRPRCFVGKRIKQDKERQVVDIDGFELTGFITNMPCNKCGEFQIYHDSHDEYFCPTCNEWTHPASNDPGWSQFKRPDRPLPVTQET